MGASAPERDWGQFVDRTTGASITVPVPVAVALRYVPAESNSRLAA
jgi:hypothetical protein